MKNEKARLIIIWVVLIVVVIGVFMSNYMLTANINYGIVEKDNVISDDHIAILKSYEADAISVLGCGLTEEGKPGPQLTDRLDAAYVLFDKEISDKIILTGSDGEDKTGVNEVKAMKEYLLEKGVPEEAITVDGKGYSTYDSMYHLATAYNLKKAIVVTQSYHIARATYIARKQGIEVCGVIAHQNNIEKKFWFEVRDFFARIKDFAKSFAKAKPKCQIEPIDLTGYEKEA